MSTLFYIALGGALGASARHIVGQSVQKLTGSAFPLGTLSVNVLGSFLMGILIGWLTFKVGGGQNWRLFLGVGILGGFTTFSAFSLDAILLMEKKAYGLMAAYIGGSILLSLLALFLGLIIMRRFGAA